MWDVYFTQAAEDWFADLSDADAQAILAPMEALEQHGPTLGRPLVDRIKGSRHHNMKELRSVGGNIRALFAFDPKRRAIILLGGDKTGNWDAWYVRNMPAADDLYDQHLANLDAPERT